MLPDDMLLGYNSDYRNINTSSTGSLVKKGGTELHQLVISNVGEVTVYVKMYDKATAPSASDTPVHTFAIPAGWIQPLEFADPDWYSTGCGIRATTGIADNDTASPATNTCVVNIHYK
jgi:hypothetical protein